MVIATNDRESGLWVPGYWESQDEKDRPPSEDELRTLFQESREYFEPFYKECRTDEDYYLGRRVVPHPEGIDPIWPSTAAAIVDTATDHVDVNNLAIDVPAPPRARARAERIKKFYLGAWLANKEPVLRTAVEQSFLYGIGFLRNMFAPDKWPDAPQLDNFRDDAAYKEALKDFQDLRCISWPLEVDVINPKNLMWDDSRKGMRWCIEWYERPVRELSRQWPEWAKRQSNTGIAKFWMYWDEEWVAYFVDNEAILGPVKHGYGFLPFTPILPVMNYTFENGPPQERYWGILRKVRSLLDEEARLLVQISAHNRRYSYQTLDFHGGRQQAEATAADYEIFGGKNIVPPGVTVEASPSLPVPQGLGEHLVRVQSYIESATFPNVVRGMRPRGVSAGFALSIMAGMGRLKFQGVADGLRHAIEQVNTKLAQLVENKIRGRITVYARSEFHNFDQTIEPDDIRGLYENSVQVKAEAPEERERESILSMRLYQAGIITLHEAQKRSGIANPLEEQMVQKAEQIANSPEVLLAQVQQVLQRIGLPSQQEQAASPTLGGMPGTNPGSQNLGGAQLPRPGEANIQKARVASNQGRPSVFPKGLPGVDALGSILSSATGGAQRVPSGQTVGR
jgi:hypothetical protein